MSQFLINRYLADLDRLRQVSGASRESVVREAFKDLLKSWGRSHELHFVPEHEYITLTKERRYIDGALLHSLRVPFGYWEAKDTNDDLDEEIGKKFRRGYPQSNIIFEDSTEAILIQNGQEVIRCKVDDVDRLERLLELFFGYQRPEIADFRKAIEQFKIDLPAVLEALRHRIDEAYDNNKAFAAAARVFLKQAKETINPTIADADVREMLIQHILTEDIFARVFGDSDFHRENNVARELYALERLFFRGDVKQQTLRALEPYYAAIRSTAALIQSHSEKQGFLKAIYENFYKVYNPKAADRLGVVYTPNEIVRFMVESADWLCQKHFGRSLIDKNVEILDPATGTGTFIVELLEHFRGRRSELKYKYLNELHANEVAILPYYVANLNIEATYAAITGEYAEFPNLCFVDTLDNVAALKLSDGVTGDLFGAVSEENIERIKRQNDRKISVIIGNPPYNANQRNENDNNKNREYPEIDKRIKATYIKESKAQKTKLYDMYSRFFRWASDRLGEEGIIAFITNRGFLDKRTFDGFRRVLSKDFSDIYVVDLGGDVRDNPKLSGTTHNVFGIQTGVAISLLIRERGTKASHLHYARRPEFERAEDKLAFLGHRVLDSVETSSSGLKSDGIWLNRTDNDFETLLPIGSKEVRSSKVAGQDSAIFKIYSLGISTNRDEWIIDHDKSTLIEKMKYFVQEYNNCFNLKEELPNTIKLSRNLKRRLLSRKNEKFQANSIVEYNYRPFVKSYLYNSKLFIDERGSADLIFGKDLSIECLSICAIGDATEKPFSVLACNRVLDLNFLSPAAAGTKYFPFRRGQSDNITDWALTKFNSHYGSKANITRADIFAYVYAVLHDPLYRDTYALNLRREFPRIPFYAEFIRWRDWGQTLLNLHVGYGSVEPYPLVQTDIRDKKFKGIVQSPHAVLKSDRHIGMIMLDTETQLSGIPAIAWDYRLGNRSAIEWILDQYKERKPKDHTVRDRFNFYRFVDHKKEIIALLKRIVTVSVKTVHIVEAMRKIPR